MNLSFTIGVYMVYSLGLLPVSGCIQSIQVTVIEVKLK